MWDKVCYFVLFSMWSSFFLYYVGSYNFLDKSVGISSLLEITGDSLVDDISQIIETPVPLHVPGVEGLIIPSQTHGHVLKVVDGNTALVRWEVNRQALSSL